MKKRIQYYHCRSRSKRRKKEEEEQYLYTIYYTTDSEDTESVTSEESVVEVNPNEVRRTRTREVKLPDKYKDYVIK